MKLISGLSNQEVQRLTSLGKTNKMPELESRSNLEIISSHVFTLFNLYNLIIGAALLYVQAYTSLFFVGVMLSNIVIFSVQEIRSKNLINKLNIIVSPKALVIREGEKQHIDNESIVLGDVIQFEPGHQIPADARILEGYVEVNESLLTGEAEPVDKGQGDALLSGSFIVSGVCYAQVIRVGQDNYAYKITSQAKEKRVIASELIMTFRKVTRLTSIFIVPLGALLLYQGLFVRDQGLSSVIVNTSTALLGMLPQGLVLLTTVNLMNSVLHLGSNKTLIQDLYAIETLSQVDVLCLDKTGTITYGDMQVIDTEIIDPNFSDYMQSFIKNSSDNNATFSALSRKYDEDGQSYPVNSSVPFSSLRKWSAMNFEGHGAIVIGAPEVIMPNMHLSEHMHALRFEGARIIAVAKASILVEKETDIGHAPLSLMATIALKDPIRTDAPDALNFFHENDVTVKVISGDNPETVYSIAKQAGAHVQDKAIDATQLITDKDHEDAILNYNIIGRATPDQKLKFIEILKENQLKVAMTGDGINDVLALRKSDCSIAMGEGSDAALHISQVVIMDGKLSTLVDVFKEGRQVINSITRSASMYYLRTIITIFLSIIAVILNVPFPFIPFQITLTNMFVDGFPSFMLLFEMNIEKPKDTILQHVARFAIPNGIAIIILWIGMNIGHQALGISSASIETIMFFINAFISLQLIYRIYKPLNLYRIGVLIVNFVGFVLGVLLFWNWLELEYLTLHEITITLLACAVSLIIIYLFHGFIDSWITKHSKNQASPY
ncbi:hydrolase [Erysipelothrix larvae]|uniref:Hydrolase n=1 Tax=Erysipelothrix larvae TaxID=1514105 RepID=A0A0X8GZX1_9FIRM|nr:HAD-IC family P-type ATPase [Erysipelothrix larvae]AMC93519.1 hydrolase [Erysipelothrix larvae]